MSEPISLDSSVNEVLERCASLVESAKDAHDLHEIAERIRDLKVEEKLGE